MRYHMRLHVGSLANIAPLAFCISPKAGHSRTSFTYHGFVNPIWRLSLAWCWTVGLCLVGCQTIAGAASSTIFRQQAVLLQVWLRCSRQNRKKSSSRQIKWGQPPAQMRNRRERVAYEAERRRSAAGAHLLSGAPVLVNRSTTPHVRSAKRYPAP